MAILITPQAAPASKQHADTCWTQTPTLNPAAFREVLGHTAGKVWLDLRTFVPRDDILLSAWRQGVNAWLLSPRTLAGLELPDTIARDTLLLAVESTATDAPTQPVDIFFWRGSTPNPDALIALEQLTKDGLATVYGLATDTTPALHDWIAAAEDAAQKVYGRRKRAGLRALFTPLNFTETDALHYPTSQHGAESVSALEHAARLGWAVVADHATALRRADGLRLPVTDSFVLPPATITALEHATAAEQALHQHLSGWPTVDGRQLFSLLAPLGQGQPPFASPAVGLGWATQLLPDILLTWQRLATQHPTAPARPYIESLQRLAFHAQALGQAAAAQATQGFFSAMQLPPSTNRPLQALQLVTSLPGVAGALAAPPALATLLPAMHQADHPDPAPCFINAFQA